MKKKALWISLGSIAALLVAAGIVLAVLRPFAFDPAKSDLSKYITLPDYKNASLTVAVDPVTDADVERQMTAFLVGKRTLNEEGKGQYFTDRALSLGDTAYIYYRGHYTDGNGVEQYLPNMCNFGSAEPSALVIGSMSFVPGFEEGLVGKSALNCSAFTRTATGTVAAGDVVYLSYIYIEGTSISQVALERVDLSDESAVDEKYGAGFYGYLVGKNFGFSGGQYNVEGGPTYYNLAIGFKTTGEESPITVEAYFPYNYQNAEDLRQVTATFDVYIVKTQLYDIPEWSDTFVTETLGYPEEFLADYEGEDLTAKLRSFVRTRLTQMNENDRKTLVEEAVWDYFDTETEVKKYPEKRVTERIESMTRELEQAFYAQSAITDINAYAAKYYSVPSSMTYAKYFDLCARSAVAEEMIFYAVARENNFLPDEETLNEKTESVIDEYFASYANQYGVLPENYKTEAEYQAEADSLRTEILRYYGRNYFVEEARYAIVMEKILALIPATETSPLI